MQLFAHKKAQLILYLYLNNTVLPPKQLKPLPFISTVLMPMCINIKVPSSQDIKIACFSLRICTTLPLHGEKTSLFRGLIAKTYIILKRIAKHLTKT